MPNSRLSFLTSLRELGTALALVFILSACGGGSDGNSEEEPPVEQILMNKLTLEVSGSGSINGNGGAISCVGSCVEDLSENTQVSLTAVAASGFVFDSWTGACSGSGACNIVMNSDKTVAAMFVAEQEPAPDEFTLTVSVNGGGEVTSTPGGINCGNNCSANFIEDTSVSLQASPANGFNFDGWSGACSGTGSCNINMNGSQSVSASFSQIVVEPNEYTLNVSVNGSGSVVSNPTGINCGNDCSNDYVENTQVQLTAQPASGYVFQNWTGDCFGNGQCSVTMTAQKSVTAIFIEEVVEPTEYTLNVDANGRGSVFSSPAGISCGNDCSALFNEGVQVSLVASADEGYLFDGWSGACSGAGSCNVTMSENRTVIANFVEDATELQFNLQVTIDGMGTVLSTPSGIDCGSDCDEDFVENTQVTLSPTPNSGYIFDHWSGDCSGRGGCSIAVDDDKMITAHFIEDDGSQADILVADYSPSGDAFQLGQIPNNASGITWHEELQQYLVVQNNSAIIYRYDQSFAYLGQIRISGIPKDTEGLSFVGDNKVMVVNEANYAHKIEVNEFNTNVDGDYDVSQGYRLLPRPTSNKGLEGTAIRKAANGQVARVFACQEGTGSNRNADMRVVYFDMPADTMSLLSYDSNLTVVEPFNAEQAFNGVVTDIAGMVFDNRTGDLIIVSQESRKAIQVNPDTGAIISQLAIDGAPQYEGVTLGQTVS